MPHQELRFYNQSIPGLSALLDSGDPEQSTQEESAWTQLEFLAVVNSSLAELDASLELLPIVKTMRLSQNQLRSIEPLKACASLQELDLSFNRIDSVAGANWILPQVISLDLSHNALRSTAGLEKLFALEVLNLSHNAIESISEVGYLVSLPNLYSLFLQGNPVASAASYRTDVQKLLTNEVVLDGVPWSSQGVDDFAKHAAVEDRHHRDSGLLGRVERRPPVSSTSSLATASEPSKEPSEAIQSNWVVVLARSVLLAIATIFIVQTGVQLTSTESTDLENDRMLLRWLGSLGAAAMLLLGAASTVSWINNQVPTANATTSSPYRAGDTPSWKRATRTEEGSMRRLSRRLSSCLVDEMYIRQDSAVDREDVRQQGTTTSDKIALDVLQTSLQSLSESPEVRLSALGHSTPGHGTLDS